MILSYSEHRHCVRCDAGCAPHNLHYTWMRQVIPRCCSLADRPGTRTLTPDCFLRGSTDLHRISTAVLFLNSLPPLLTHWCCSGGTIPYVSPRSASLALSDFGYHTGILCCVRAVMHIVIHTY